MTQKPSEFCGSRERLAKSFDPDYEASITHVSVFKVPQMDCPSEENLIRTAFVGFGDAFLFEFDIPNRKVHIFHGASPEKVEQRMNDIGLGAQRISLQRVEESSKKLLEKNMAKDSQEAWILKWLLGINAMMFLVELVVGIFAQSTGLIADSLDMFADAAVYLVAFYAIGKASEVKLKAAHISGWLQMILAIGLLLEVSRRTIMGGEPVSLLMMGVGSIALMANIACLILVFKVRNNGTHMKASMIFSANDVVANTGVIVAGALVAITGSQIPDLIIGLIIVCMVMWGSVRILKLR